MVPGGASSFFLFKTIPSYPLLCPKCPLPGLPHFKMTSPCCDLSVVKGSKLQGNFMINEEGCDEGKIHQV